MEEICFETFKTAVRLNFRNFRERPRGFKPVQSSIEMPGDLDIHLYMDEDGSVIRNIRKGPLADGVIQLFGGACCLIHDVKRMRTSCFFEKGVNIDSIMNRAVNVSFIAFQSLLGVIFLHAASIVMGGRSYLFIAPSGGGKSTICSLAREAGLRVLDDESCMVKKHNGCFYASTFPCFLPSFVEQEEWEIGGVILLNKSGRNRSRPISVLDAMKRSIPDAMVFFRKPAPGIGKAEYRKNVFDFLECMFSRLKLRQLDFRKDPGVFGCLDLT
ncbi:MAG: hypothetical protein U9R44_07625 [Candidatus Omnitrophota bacterium]|nr:hypothetical protein [Candidatus Omnitrophota bacterium]